jgi:hypothetical protein
MKSINMPGFTAEASLYISKVCYARSFQQQGLGGQQGELHRAVLIPQLGGPGFKGYRVCVDDCREEHPDWTTARCEARCRDPGIGGPIGDNDSFWGSFLGALEVIGGIVLFGLGMFTGGPPSDANVDHYNFCQAFPEDRSCGGSGYPPFNFCEEFPEDPRCR